MKLPKRTFIRIHFVVLALLLFGCSTSRVFYGSEDKNWNEASPLSENKLAYSLYLLGDAGEASPQSNQVLSNVSKHLKNADSNKSGIVFLGDNIYPVGLHKKNSEYRAQDEARLNPQLNMVKDFDGEVVFIPGNHDWKSGKDKGINYVKRQGKYIEKYLNKENVFLPANGCPGPTEVQLAPGLMLIVIDTQWWLHQFEKSSGEKDGCDVRSTKELKEAFYDMLKKYRNQNIIVVGHHPLYSNGQHGGNFKVKDHIFPLTALDKKAYVPLPGIGSIYPFYRKFIGINQDIVNPTYSNMKNDMEAEMNEFYNIIYASGHEHNLQYVHEDNIHHVISGSASKVTPMKFNNGIDFGAEKKGYSKISYYENGEIWLDFVTIDDKTSKEKTAYRKLLYVKKAVKSTAQNYSKTSYDGMFKTVYPDSLKKAQGIKTVLLGKLNRDLWTTPLKIPYLDIHYEKGGLTPIKKGGGMQTLSLRMLGGNGKQYTLRGVKKSPEFIITHKLRRTLAQDLIYDGFAGSHPYAGVVIPYLSEDVDIYYSDSKLVYIPKDSVLGDYMEEFGGMFCLLEQRPDDDVSDQANYGNSDKVMSFTKMLEKTHSKPSHKIDKDFVVRTRAFDMLIGDFDRHDDQWRWARFKEDDYTLYRPIPRDRDQAFFRADGVSMNVTKWRWLLWYTQDFYGGAEDVLGLNTQARHFDRSFLTEATLEDWVTQAKYIQSHLSDQEIEAAVRHFPPEVFDIRGPEIIESLIIRRDELVDYVTEYYYSLAKEVDVVGHYGDDFISIKRKINGDVEVSAYPRKDGKKVKSEIYYHRVFQRKDTKEIRLFGLDGNDEYQITGNVKKSILIRIIAGEGKDKIEDKSSVNGLKKMTRVYDLKGKSNIDKGKDTKLTVMNADDMYDYDRLEYEYNMLKPALSLGFNPNDGFLIGPGFDQTIHGFKKDPYKFHHTLLANYMFGTVGFNVYYDFDLIDTIGDADLGGSLVINNPLAYFYYGDVSDDNINDISAYNVLMNNYEFTPTLTYSSSSGASKLVFGPKYKYINFESEAIPNVDDWELKQQHFLGGILEYQFLNKDNNIHPHSGMEFKIRGEYVNSLGNDNVEYLNINSSLSLFIPINFIEKQTTIAFRSGIATNIGDFAFFQANFLSGYENFRGVRRNRYAGESIGFSNLELRMNLFEIQNYVLPFDVGILGHYDFARVWTKSIEDWHHSFGGGAFINTIDAFMLFGTYSISDHDGLLVIGSKFLF
ncbi:MAG: metallophosphoesterase [Reichenbachiella sp.]